MEGSAAESQSSSISSQNEITVQTTNFLSLPWEMQRLILEQLEAPEFMSVMKACPDLPLVFGARTMKTLKLKYNERLTVNKFGISLKRFPDNDVYNQLAVPPIYCAVHFSRFHIEEPNCEVLAKFINYIRLNRFTAEHVHLQIIHTPPEVWGLILELIKVSETNSISVTAAPAEFLALPEIQQIHSLELFSTKTSSMLRYLKPKRLMITHCLITEAEVVNCILDVVEGRKDENTYLEVFGFGSQELEQLYFLLNRCPTLTLTHRKRRWGEVSEILDIDDDELIITLIYRKSVEYLLTILDRAVYFQKIKS